MKTIASILLIIFSCCYSFAQPNNGINICGKESKENITVLTLNELIKCPELKANNVHLTVVSFILVIIVDRDKRIIKVEGNRLTEKMVTSRNQFNYSRLYIENIKLSSKKGTIQPGKNHTIILK